jgi:hypothetical protein
MSLISYVGATSDETMLADSLPLPAAAAAAASLVCDV